MKRMRRPTHSDSAGFDQELPEGLAGFRAHFFNASGVSFDVYTMSMCLVETISMLQSGSYLYRMNSHLEYLRAEGDRIDHIDGSEDRHCETFWRQIFISSRQPGSFSPPGGMISSRRTCVLMPLLYS